MFKVKVTPDSGESFEVVSTTRDIVQWEKRNKNNSFAQLQADMHMTDVYRVTYIAARRQGLFNGTEAEFMESVDIDILGDNEPDPTQSEVSAEV